MAARECNDNVGRCHCILMLFFLADPVEPTGYVVHSNTVEKSNINAEMMLFMSKLEPSRHTEHFLEQGFFNF